MFIVNEDNPVQSLTRQQLKDIYAGTITNWKDVGGKDQEIIAFQRRADSGSQTHSEAIDPGRPADGGPTELAPPPWVSWWTALQSITTPPTPSVSRSTTHRPDSSSPVCGCWPWMAMTPFNRRSPTRATRCATRILCRHPAGFRCRQPERRIYEWLSTDTGRSCIEHSAM